MSAVPSGVTVDIALDDPGLAPVIELLVHKAFIEGYRHGRNQDKPYPSPGDAYHDWRGWGPGALLPGGSAYRRTADMQAARTSLEATP